MPAEGGAAVTFYHACTGCVLQGKPCDSRDAVRARLKGIGVTSIKWRCWARSDRFKVGDPVWALTVDGGVVSGDEGEPIRDHFPGTVIRLLGAKALVFIPPGARGRDEECTFTSNCHGFCKLPLSRLSPRDGPAEEICRSCEQPALMGHIDGYVCALQTKRDIPVECPF